LEAGYFGLPVVAAAIPGVDEIIVDGHNGYLIPNHDPAQYVAAIRLLLDNPTLAESLGKQAKQRIEAKFLRCHNTQRIIEIYHSLVSKP
jgi:glycosyltransferase involved in cell wall biosynthesis